MISELPVRSKCNNLSFFFSFFFVLALGAVAYEVRSSINARDHSSLVLRTHSGGVLNGSRRDCVTEKANNVYVCKV